MPSKSTDTRQNQKARFLEQIEARKEALKERRMPDEAIAKDSKLRSLKAKIGQINAALGRIKFLEDQTEELRRRKEEAKAAAEAEKAEGKKKKKGKKKEEAEQAMEGKKKAKGGGKGKAPAVKGKAQPGKAKGKGK